jgi:hypothetical protein
MLRRIGLPALVAGALLTLFSATPASAQHRGGGENGHGYSGGGGRSYSRGGGNNGGRSFSGGGRDYSRGGGHNGGQNFSRGYNGGGREGSRGFSGGGRGWDRDRGYGGGRYNGGSRLYFNYGAPYAYGPGYACDPAGYYDRWGNFRYYAGCAPYPY